MAITLECGQHDDPNAPEIGYRAILNAMAHLAMIEAPRPEPRTDIEVRLAGIEMISYTSGPLLGNVESGVAAAVAGIALISPTFRKAPRVHLPQHEASTCARAPGLLLIRPRQASSGQHRQRLSKMEHNPNKKSRENSMP